MQVRAIFEAACTLTARGVDARPEVMIPGVGTKEEMQATRDAAKRVADEVLAQQKESSCAYRIGTMIELPRACVVAGELARLRRVLLVRHQRSNADHLRLQPRRRRRRRSFRSTSRSGFSRKIRSRCSIASGVGELMREAVAQGARRAAGTSRSASAASTAASRAASHSARVSASTTSRVRLIACRSRAWPRRKRQSAY